MYFVVVNHIQNRVMSGIGWTSGFTKADCKVTVAPDVEIKQEVLVELRQQSAVALTGDLLQQQLACHQYTHIHHCARHLTQRGSESETETKQR